MRISSSTRRVVICATLVIMSSSWVYPRRETVSLIFQGKGKKIIIYDLFKKEKKASSLETEERGRWGTKMSSSSLEERGWGSTKLWVTSRQMGFENDLPRHALLSCHEGGSFEKRWRVKIIRFYLNPISFFICSHISISSVVSGKILRKLVTKVLLLRLLEWLSHPQRYSNQSRFLIPSSFTISKKWLKCFFVL